MEKQHSRLAHLLWRDRRWQDEVGQPYIELCLLSRVRNGVCAIWRSTHWSVTGIYTATLAFVVALATTWVSGKNNDVPLFSSKYQSHPGVVLLECSPDVGGVLRCKQLPRQENQHGVTGPQNNPASNVNAQKQAAAQEK
ncbi:hypothetical protein [Cupriavidus pauculus]|uniref:hypothetical protein n=1 Tax=Cupriavidus pauculus TaxID=82633 RepID=UPI0007813D69|nr:hypothetical protein [Cupriavidus pauculus]